MFYKIFLNDYKNWYSLTTNEQIVYSRLLNNALLELGSDSWGNDKDRDMDYIYDCLDFGDGYIEFKKPKYSLLSEQTNISYRSLVGKDGVISSLIDKGLIRKRFGNLELYTEKDIVKGGYFQLFVESKLKEKQLLFFTFLCERLRFFNQKQYRLTNNPKWLDNKALDTWASRLANDFGTTKKSVQKLMEKLQEKNYIKRAKNNKYFWVNVNLKDIVVKKEECEFMEF